MGMNQVNLVYFSAAGTTKLVANTLAACLAEEIREYDLLRQPPAKSIAFEADTPVVFALPVYAGRIPALCVELLNKYKGKGTPAIAVVVYGNREYDDALHELCAILRENGFSVVAAAAFVAQHSIFPEVASGRPDETDKQAIRAFGEACVQKLRGFTGNESVVVKGNLPYTEPSEIPIKPSTNAHCNACGTCIVICPAGAIPEQNPKKTDKARCISCAACIAVCPQKARAFRGPVYNMAAKAFTQKNKARKEPETFFAE